MKFYLYRPDANHFAGIGADHADDPRVVGIHHPDAPLASRWIPVVFHGYKEDPPQEGDFPSLNNRWRIPIFSQRAWDALKPLIGYCCEALPIVHPSGNPFYIIHVMETIDCLDTNRSEFSLNGTRISRVYKYCLKLDMLREKHIFKLPRESGADLIVDDKFRKAVESNGLRGLKFEELPMANSAGTRA